MELELKTDLVPAREKSDRVLIVLHGLGDSMEGYRDTPEMLRLPWLNYLLVNAPDPYYGGFSWYDYAGDSTPGVLRSRKLLTALVDKMAANFPAEKIGLFGFSQGCLMTLETGLRYPKKLAALVGVSGYLNDPNLLISELPPTAKEQRILWTHGTRDPLIPLAPVRAQMEQLRQAGLQIQWEEFPKEHTIALREIDVIREFLVKSFA
jgi:phospholipase/carboxylesterase